MKRLLLLLVLFITVISFGQAQFISNCNNAYFSSYCTDDMECNLDIFDEQAFIEQESDTTSLITWFSLTNGNSSSFYGYQIASITNSPGNSRNEFSAFILSNDDVIVSRLDNGVYKISPSQNQFNYEIFGGTQMPNLNWQSLYTFGGSCSQSGKISNTNFCEGLNGEIYYAYCDNAMTNIVKITNDSIIDIIADSLPGVEIKSLTFHDSTLYVANSQYVYKYNSNILSDLNFQNTGVQSIKTLELNNDGVPYVVSLEGINYGAIYKYLNNSWHSITDSIYFWTSQGRDFLDFGSNNTGYFLAENISSGGLSIYKLENDSVILFNDFSSTIDMSHYVYALELDNLDNPFIAYIDNNNQIGLIKSNGTNWSTILNNNTANPLGYYDYIDLQFNSQNDLYLMYEGHEDAATIVTFCNCDIQPHSQTSILSTNKSNLKTHPNPTSDQITIDINGYNGVVNIEVYDLQGRLLETTTNTTVSLKKHAKGIYVLKVSYGEITEEVRVIRE